MSVLDTLPATAGSSNPRLAPWLQAQLESLLAQRGHAWLLSGPSGLGQFELALALARAWLCEEATPQGACGHCGSCHAVDVHTHADLCMLMPETLSLALGWPLDEKTQDDLDSKKRKPSKEIKVDAAREAVSFTQFTRSRGTTKVVLVFPAERMNNVTANTLLKTLEEPPGAVKFVLATEAAHQLLPTIRSRCLGHTMVWPDFGQALGWLQQEITLAGDSAGNTKKAADWAPAQAVDALQKLCHDVLVVRMGAAPRFFHAGDLPAALPAAAGKTGNGLYALASWSKELAAIARTVEHPYNPGLMLESLVSRARTALNAK